MSLVSSKNMDWCTPDAFYQNLDQEFNFELDAAATDRSAKSERYYTPEMCGLKNSWYVSPGRAVFCNPPYGRGLADWVRKAYTESQNGNTVVLLIPARTDTGYFHDYILGKAEIRFIRGRLKFTDEDGVVKDAAPFPSMLVIYRPGSAALSADNLPGGCIHPNGGRILEKFSEIIDLINEV